MGFIFALIGIFVVFTGAFVALFLVAAVPFLIVRETLLFIAEVKGIQHA